jgi:DNA-binding response OmpR family regulator
VRAQLAALRVCPLFHDRIVNSSTSAHSSPEAAGRVLVLAPDENLASAIRAALREAAPGAQVEVAASLEEAQGLVVSHRPDLFVLDVDATYDLGQEFLYDLRTSHPNARAIVLTATHLATDRARAAGLGAIHFLEKPFPHSDFVTLAEALLLPGDEGGEKFQGKLSDLHIADIIQLKCMSGTTSVLEFTGPGGGKARVFFDHGQVRHAVAPGKQGIAAFNEIVQWKGGTISEVSGAGPSPRTIDLDWQVLLMEAVRHMDETQSEEAAAAAQPAAPPARRKVLVIDDSLMLLNFVKEILAEAGYEVTAAGTAAEGLSAATSTSPDLILLDYVLPDMKGDDVVRRLRDEPATNASRVVYMSGFGTDLPDDPNQHENVVGSLNKPFTSDLLLKTVETYMPNESAENDQTQGAGEQQPLEAGWAPADNPDVPQENTGSTEGGSDSWAAPAATVAADSIWNPNPPAIGGDVQAIETAAGGGQSDDAWWSAPPPPAWQESSAAIGSPADDSSPADSQAAIAPVPANVAAPETGGTFFSGDTSFFSLNWALHAIGSQRLTGTLRLYWEKEPVELLARNGEVLLATTRDSQLYCEEAPITLVNIDEARITAARDQQRESGRPLFITLAQEELILREPAIQLVQHYGQKLFAQLWTAPRVRFAFEQQDQLPAFATEVPGETDIDHWALGTLRFIQFTDLGSKADYDPNSIPAYTRDGFERVQKLRLTVAEAQFASQFNGGRSIAQIAKNLRLDLKFARLTLFRFMALEIVELWPAATTGGAKQEKRGVFGRIFGE